ncbi:hypothetical protein HXX76_012988 [Chlamydomonas incerta]|uniref:EGF-like domain-containing protein n=1 Tax=Chlamydomonas incerta TaxID=51695 RepID=A0A835SNA6_CHLIN|nr:hypothetical protein HXX76_012988 [Chlamydomonas incerta]|eukprot:KAG2426678.1 hypothetical protein HXX76_012988 [Chlamydomonas incerta]
MPKNCFCHAQLRKYGCPRPFFEDPYNCPFYQFWAWNEISCFVIKDVPEDQQYTLSPDGPSDPRVLWKKGYYNQSNSRAGTDPYQLVDAPPPTPYTLPDQSTWLPLEQCGASKCSGRGWCALAPRIDGQAPPQAKCHCMGFYDGDNCEKPQPEHCFQSCSGRGTCRGGFCHCQAGFWGLACTRNQAYVSDTWLPHPSKLRVYVYSIPEQLAFKKPWHDIPALVDTMYLAEVAFVDSLLGDSAVLTQNPWEANLFLINAYTFYFTGNIGYPARHFSSIFQYVRTKFPFWNMTAGRNHIALATNDRGTCDLYKLQRSQPDLSHPIKLVHYGQAGRLSIHSHRTFTIKGQPHEYDPAFDAAVREWRRLALRAQRLHGGSSSAAPVDEEPGGEGEGGPGGGGPGGGGAEGGRALNPLELIGERVRFKGVPGYSLEAIRMEREPCFRPEQDVAIPNYLDTPWLNLMDQAFESLGGGRYKPKPVDRPYLFHFHGFTKPDMAYSGGVRQGLLAMFKNMSRPEVLINKGAGPGYTSKAKFCMAPLGYGWGIRFTQAMFTGCVPVIIQDHIYTYFWDVVPYEKFSIRISRHNLHRLFDIIDAVTPEQLADLQQGVADYHQHFSWHGRHGGLAYNNTMISLHRRLLNMWTALFPGTT